MVLKLVVVEDVFELVAGDTYGVLQKLVLFKLIRIISGLNLRRGRHWLCRCGAGGAGGASRSRR